MFPNHDVFSNNIVVPAHASVLLETMAWNVCGFAYDVYEVVPCDGSGSKESNMSQNTIVLLYNTTRVCERISFYDKIWWNWNFAKFLYLLYLYPDATTTSCLLVLLNYTQVIRNFYESKLKERNTLNSTLEHEIFYLVNTLFINVKRKK